MLDDMVNKVGSAGKMISDHADALHVQAIKESKRRANQDSLRHCTDIYMGLERLFGLGLDYIVLDNPRQYQIMCMDNRWIQDKPITNVGGSLCFDYEYQGKVYQIQSSAKADGAVLFFTVGDE